MWNIKSQTIEAWVVNISSCCLRNVCYSYSIFPSYLSTQVSFCLESNICVWKDCVPSWARVQGRFFSMAFSIRSQLVLESCACSIASRSLKSFCTQPFLMLTRHRIAFKPIYYNWVTWDFIYEICTYYPDAKFKEIIAQHDAGNDAIFFSSWCITSQDPFLLTFWACWAMIDLSSSIT